jgi:hypothetical protein
MPANPFDMNFFSAYDSKIGFSFDFEVLNGQPAKDSIFQMMVSLFPPALPYQKPPKTDKAFTLSQVMWERATPGYFLFDED